MTTNPGEIGEGVAVVQADREAAGALWEGELAFPTRRSADMFCGLRDGDHIVQAFARHRLAHTGPRGPEVSRAWQPIETVERENGLRLILAWDDCPTLPFHWEVGRWSRDLGWVNTYGKPFGAGEPTHWMLPDAPSALTPATRTGEVELEADFKALHRDYGRTATLINIMRDRWQAVAEALNDIEGGMHADLEDAASAMQTACDEPKATLAALATGETSPEKGAGE